MASTHHMQALAKAQEALSDIRLKLKPLLELLNTSESAAASTGKQPTKGTNRMAVLRHSQATSAVALAVGTLRFMGLRLRGIAVAPTDPLRAELQQMRALLKQLQARGKEQLEKEAAAEQESSPPVNSDKKTVANEEAAVVKEEKEAKKEELDKTKEAAKTKAAKRRQSTKSATAEAKKQEEQGGSAKKKRRKGTK